MGLDFKAANAVLLRDVPGFCKKFLPRGKQAGAWWLAPVPWRKDNNPSLGVHLTSGRWKDFGRDGSRGDLLDLIAKIKNVAVADVVRSLV